MATGTEGGRSFAQSIPQPSHRGAPAPNPASATSPPSKREIASWLGKLRKRNEKDEEKVPTAPGIFNVPLAESIRYANVAISLTNEQGESFIYGYVPIVVAKCGVFLKEKATDVEGIFRLSGSAKRIKDLQTIFNSPDRYGKGLDWTGYTVHDAANILRRYLNQLPEPIVPLNQYEKFRDPLRSYQKRLEQHPEGQPPPEIDAQEHANAVVAYQRLITELPALNRQLLLYILDLLAVFSSKSDLNRMTAANLAAIFQPGIISHPDHDMAPQEYRLSQDVLIFLIENQDNFLIGMTGTGLDEKTQKAVESGAPSLKSPKANIGRSASNASGGADSLRKLRRNASVSSHTSREKTSPNASGPNTPASPSYPAGSSGIGIARSNTVPSKRSPAIGQHRFQRNANLASPTSTIPTNSVAQTGQTAVTPEPKKPIATQRVNSEGLDNVSPTSDSAYNNSTIPFPDIPTAGQSAEVQQTPQHPHPSSLQVPKNQPTPISQTRERKISNLFSKSPFLGPADAPSSSQRLPRKLQKKQRLPGTMSESAQSSAASLQGEDPFHTPTLSSDLAHSQMDPTSIANQVNKSTVHNPNSELSDELTPPQAQDIQGRGSVAQKSPATSLRSGTSITDASDFDALDDPVVKAEKKRSRWRFSSSARRTDEGPLAPPPPIGQHAGARTSNSSIGSTNRPRQSFTAESHLTQQFASDATSIGHPSTLAYSSHESAEPQKEGITEVESRGFFGKLKAKMAQSKEERREREAEKERAKSPQRMTGDNASSRNSLSAIAHDHFAHRGRSFDKSREDILRTVNEQPKAEAQAAMAPIKTVPHQNTAHALAPQTATVTGSVPVAAAVPPSSTVSDVPDVPSGKPDFTSPDVSDVTSSLPIRGVPGPAVASNIAPIMEETRLEVDTQAREIPPSDSLQHTPTEVKGPPLDT